MALFAGAKVQARYMDGDAWFDGKIKRVNGSDRYAIVYDDGKLKDVSFQL
jgi:hypothetical protein